MNFAVLETMVSICFSRLAHVRFIAAFSRVRSACICWNCSAIVAIRSWNCGLVKYWKILDSWPSCPANAGMSSSSRVHGKLARTTV